MIQSRITSRGRTTIPRPVLEALGLEEGDVLHYVVDGHQLIATRRPAPDMFIGNFSTFIEWDDDKDRVYDGL